jgi:hypothetical protein
MDNRSHTVVIGLFDHADRARGALGALKDAGLVVADVDASAVASGLVNMGIPTQEADFYDEEVRRGNELVAVRTQDLADQAAAIVHRCGAYDVLQHELATAA